MSKLTKKLTKNPKYTALALLAIVLFAALGVHLLQASHAATSTVVAEAENGTITSPATKVTDTTASGGSAIKFGTAVTPTPPPVGPTPPPSGATLTVPSGYKQLYYDDFTSNLGWTARTGKTNNAAQFRAAEVTFFGSNGQVLTAHRDSSTAQIYSGATNQLKNLVPQHFDIQWRQQTTPFVVGAWPSFWLRPSSGTPGDGEGEIDLMEGFGGHLDGSAPRVFGCTMIATPYGTSQVNVGLNYGIASSTYSSEHTYEVIKTANQMECKIDGKSVGTITSAKIGSKWASEFEDGKSWYMRRDFQFGDDPDGSPKGDAGVPASSWTQSTDTMRELLVSVPN